MFTNVTFTVEKTLKYLIQLKIFGINWLPQLKKISKNTTNVFQKSYESGDQLRNVQFNSEDIFK